MKSPIFAILLTCVLSLTVIGQTTNGSVSGTVTDSKGAVVAGAILKLTNTATGSERTATTSDVGSFDFQTLQPGNYSASVEGRASARNCARYRGFGRIASQISIVLEVGAPTETVTVMAAGSDQHCLSYAYQRHQHQAVVDLPLGGRNPVDLLDCSRYCGAGNRR